MSVSLCLEILTLLLYGVCKNVAIVEIPHGFGQTTSTYTLVHIHIHPSAKTQSRYVVRFCCKLHYVYQLPLSFKNFYFPYLNMLIFFQLSFRATWYPLHPTAAKSQFLSVFLCLSICLIKQKRVKWYRIVPTRFSV